MSQQQITYGKYAKELQSMLKYLLRDLLVQIREYEDFEIYNTLDLNNEAAVITRGISTLESAVDYVASKKLAMFDTSIKDLDPSQRGSCLIEIVESFTKKVANYGKRNSKGKELVIIHPDEQKTIDQMNESITNLQGLVYKLELMENIEVNPVES